MYFHYFNIWLFSVTDSFVRVAPVLMFISFIAQETGIHDSKQRIAKLIMFLVLYVAQFVFEFRVLRFGWFKYGISSDDDNDRENNNRKENLKNRDRTLKIIDNNINNNEDEDGNSNNSNSLMILTEDIIFSIYSVVSNALYLMALIGVPYLQYKKAGAKYFVKYQICRIIASCVIISVVGIMQLVAQSSYFVWMYLICGLVIVFHCASLKYVNENVVGIEHDVSIIA